MEFTEYSCLDVIESSLLHEKKCPFTCKHDSNISGFAECICRNEDDAVADGNACHWKFPAYSSVCGPARMAAVDAAMADLETQARLSTQKNWPWNFAFKKILR